MYRRTGAPARAAGGDLEVLDLALMKASGDRVIVRVRQLMAAAVEDIPPDDADPTLPILVA